MKKILLLTASIISLSTAHAIAQDEDLNELMDLSLEELLVSVASKRDETIVDAPGIVNVILREEIEASGAQKVTDLLQRLPEYISYGSASNPGLNNVIRGNFAGADSNVLFLLNGRPVRDGWSSGVNYGLTFAFPVSFVERIEMIRGPGSVLYGTSAFAGVVNVVTREPNSDQNGLSGETSFTYGSFGTVITDNNFGYQKDNLKISTGIRAIDTDGWTQDGLDFTGNDGEDQYAEHGYNIAGTIEYKNLKISGFKYFRNTDSFGFPISFPFLEDSSFEQFFIDAGYEQPLSGTWKANLNASYNTHTTDYLVRPSTDDFNFEGNLSGQITDNSNLIVGGNYEVLRGDETTTDLSYRTYLANVYTQADWRPVDWLKLIGGIQINKAEAVDRNFTPRLGAIVNFNESWGVKALYSEAFRAASPFDQFLNIPLFITGTPGLKPETIETFDAQIFYKTPDIYAALTAFKSRQFDGIGPNTSSVVVNFDNVLETHGVAAELEWQALDNLKIRSSVSYQTSGEEGTNVESAFTTPEFLVKAALSWQATDAIAVNLDNFYVSDGIPADFTTDTNPNPGDFLLVDANIDISIPKLLKNSKIPDITFSIQGKNLLNEETFLPDNSTQIPGLAVNSFENYTDRAVFGRVTWKF